MHTSKPDSLHIDRLRQIPDFLGGVHGVGVIGVHYAGVVEHDIYAAPRVDLGNHGGDRALGRDVTLNGLEAGPGVGEDGLNFGECGGEGGYGDVGHKDRGAFAGEENSRFKADAPDDGESRD